MYYNEAQMTEGTPGSLPKGQYFGHTYNSVKSPDSEWYNLFKGFMNPNHSFYKDQTARFLQMLNNNAGFDQYATQLRTTGINGNSAANIADLLRKSVTRKNVDATQQFKTSLLGQGTQMAFNALQNHDANEWRGKDYEMRQKELDLRKKQLEFEMDQNSGWGNFLSGLGGNLLGNLIPGGSFLSNLFGNKQSVSGNSSGFSSMPSGINRISLSGKTDFRW